MSLLGALLRPDPPAGEALRVEDRALDHAALRGATGAVAARVAGAQRVAVWAEPALETCVGVLGALAAGVPVVPLNPALGARELQHVVGDAQPDVVVARAGVELPETLAGVHRLEPTLDAPGPHLPTDEADRNAPAFVLYTSGTTGPPKGAILPRRAVASNLDALADAWGWTAADVLVHGLPLFHVHGLVLGMLGPLRLGGRLHHLGRFSPAAVAKALAGDGTMLFGVPTMYHRLATAAEQDRHIADALRQARLLVSGSAALPLREHERLRRTTGQRVLERYGLTETLINCAVRADGDHQPGSVGPPLPGVELRLLDDAGTVIEASDDETIGEVVVRGPNVFSGYLNRPDATAAALRDGWFHTGDLATRAAGGYVRIVGRRATDLIKTGGYKVGAGEIEAVLLEHPAVAEAAVLGEPDEDLGERIVAFVVARDGREPPAERELADHVAGLLAPHKRPRAVRLLAELPRNEMGKVRKAVLREPGAGAP